MNIDPNEIFKMFFSDRMETEDGGPSVFKSFKKREGGNKNSNDQFFSNFGFDGFEGLNGNSFKGKNGKNGFTFF